MEIPKMDYFPLRSISLLSCKKETLSASKMYLISWITNYKKKSLNQEALFSIFLSNTIKIGLKYLSRTGSICLKFNADFSLISYRLIKLNSNGSISQVLSCKNLRTSLYHQVFRDFYKESQSHHLKKANNKLLKMMLKNLYLLLNLIY